MTLVSDHPSISKDQLVARFHHGIEEVEADWKQLFSRSLKSAFHSFGAMRLFLQQAGKEAGIVIAVICDKTNDQPLAIFPMIATRKSGMKMLALADLNVVDYGLAVFDTERVGPKDVDVVMRVLAANAPADFLYCNKVPAELVGRHNSLVDARNMALLPVSSWHISPDGDYDAFAKEHYSGQTKKVISKRKRKLAKDHERVFEIATGDAVTKAHFDMLLDMRREWASCDGRCDILGDPEWQSFYHNVASGQGGDTKAWISQLKADGEVIAILFGLMCGDHVIGLLPASKRGPWKTYSAGIQLFDETIRWFHTQGYAQFDVSIGDQPYKTGLGATKVPLYDAVYPALDWLVGPIISSGA